jgi:surface polysaccharide O-acyltransferase-like enzyme
MLMLHERTPEHGVIVTILAAMFNVNLFVFYGVTGTELQSRVVGIDLSTILAMLYVVAWLFLVVYAWGAPQQRKESERGESEIDSSVMVSN